MIYFDNAATSSYKPEKVVIAVKTALEKMSANPGRSGHSLSVKAAEKIYMTREKVANFFGCEHPENVVFTANCTQSVNFVLKGVLSQGDHLLISNLEHNAVARPAHKLKENGINVGLFNAMESDIESELEKRITPKTKMIFCIHASNICSKVLPIERIGAFCKKKGILFGVDAAQSAGVIPIDMKKDGIDFLCIAAHKGLFAPMGTGILIADAPFTRTVLEGGTGSNSISLEQGTDMPEMLESGTLNLPGIMGISAGIDYVKNKGIKNIQKHEKELCDRLYYRLESNPYVSLYYYPEAPCVPVVSIKIKGVDSNTFAEFLNKNGICVRAGLHCSPLAHKTLGTVDGGTVRFSPGIMNTKKEVDYFARLTEEFCTKIYKK